MKLTKATALLAVLAASMTSGAAETAGDGDTSATLRDTYKLQKGMKLVFETKTSMTQTMYGVPNAQPKSAGQVEQLTYFVTDGPDSKGICTVVMETVGGEDPEAMMPGVPDVDQLDAKGLNSAGKTGSPFPGVPKAATGKVTLALGPNAVATTATVTDGQMVRYSAENALSPNKNDATVMHADYVLTLADGIPATYAGSLTMGADMGKTSVTLSMQGITRLIRKETLNEVDITSATKDAVAMDKVSKKIVKIAQSGKKGSDEEILAMIDENLATKAVGKYSDLLAAAKARFERNRNPEANTAPNAPKVGEEAPDFTVEAIDGTSVTLSKLKGKVVLLDFWATWCGPCMIELPTIKALQDKYADKGLVIVGVSLDEKMDDLKKCIADKKINWTIVPFATAAPNRILPTTYKVLAIPSVFVIGRDGKIVATDIRGEELTAKIAELIK